LQQDGQLGAQQQHLDVVGLSPQRFGHTVHGAGVSAATIKRQRLEQVSLALLGMGGDEAFGGGGGRRELALAEPRQADVGEGGSGSRVQLQHFLRLGDDRGVVAELECGLRQGPVNVGVDVLEQRRTSLRAVHAGGGNLEVIRQSALHVSAGERLAERLRLLRGLDLHLSVLKQRLFLRQRQREILLAQQQVGQRLPLALPHQLLRLTPGILLPTG